MARTDPYRGRRSPPWNMRVWRWCRRNLEGGMQVILNAADVELLLHFDGQVPVQYRVLILALRTAALVANRRWMSGR